MNPTHRLRTDQRGIALPLAGIGILAVLSFGLVTMEIGQISVVSSELQNAADGAALAAGMALADPNGDVDASARSIVTRNTVSSRDGGHALGEVNIVSVEVGNYTFDGGFVANLPPSNAVEVVLTNTVENLAFQPTSQDSTTTQQARSVAALVPARLGRSWLPIAIGCCEMGPSTSCCPPAAPVGDECVPSQPIAGVVTPAKSQTRWTNYSNADTTIPAIRANFPSGPTCGAPCGAQASEPVENEVGDGISIRQSTSADIGALSCVQQCYLNAGITDTFLPIVGCEPGTSEEILGFGSFRVTSASAAGITLQAIPAPVQTGPPGGDDYGVRTLVLAD